MSKRNKIKHHSGGYLGFHAISSSDLGHLGGKSSPTAAWGSRTGSQCAGCFCFSASVTRLCILPGVHRPPGTEGLGWGLLTLHYCDQQSRPKGWDSEIHGPLHVCWHLCSQGFSRLSLGEDQGRFRPPVTAFLLLGSRRMLLAFCV